jgi:NADP-dependent 3-hydroxy acid dehydrogenase YdfG
MGRATALLLAKGGARLALAARRRERLESLAAELADSSAEPLLITADVRVEAECISAVESCLQRFGRIDVLINNAGVGYPSDLATVPTDQYRTMMETNVDGVFYMTRAVLPVMKKQKRGDIIMISSPAGVTANPVAPLYCTSKFALEGFTQGLRLQLDQLHDQGIHIRVMDVLPGATNSEYWGDRKVPRDSFMTTEEMASVILQTVATTGTVVVKKIEVEQFRFAD